MNGAKERDGYILLVKLYGGNIFQGSSSDSAVNTINQRHYNAVDKLSLSPVDRLNIIERINFLDWCYILVIPSLCLNRQARVVQTGAGGWGGEYIVDSVHEKVESRQQTFLFSGMAFLGPV